MKERPYTSEIPKGYRIMADWLIGRGNAVGLTNRSLSSVNWHLTGSLNHGLAILSEKNKIIERIKVLDIAAGRWMRSAYELAEVYPEIQVVGLDIVLLREKGLPNFHQVQADAFNLPFDNSSFDLIYSLGLIPYYEVEKDYQMERKFIGEVARVLKPDGVALIDARFSSFTGNCNQDGSLELEAGIKMSPIKIGILQKISRLFSVIYSTGFYLGPDDYLFIEKPHSPGHTESRTT